MHTSISLAQIVGPTFAILGIGVLFNSKQIAKMANEYVKNEGLLFLTGMISVVIGLLMVQAHNYWESNWTIIITIISWVVLIKGALLLIAPKAGANMSRKLGTETVYMISGLVYIVLGVYLSVMGYMA
jgi:uncharacterized protein YjeT (DUF2065 family)